MGWCRHVYSTIQHSHTPYQRPRGVWYISVMISSHGIDLAVPEWSRFIIRRLNWDETLCHTWRHKLISFPVKSSLYGDNTWWRHQMETFSALLAICAGNSPVTGEFPAHRPVTRSFDVFVDLLLNRRWGWWFETPSSPLWRHCNEVLHTRIPRPRGAVQYGVSTRPVTHLKLKSREISFVHDIHFSCLIVLKFYTEHGNDSGIEMYFGRIS